MVTGLHEHAEPVANFLAFENEFGAVFAGVGEDGDEPGVVGAEFVQETVNGPGGEDIAFAELAGPMEDEDAAGAVVEDPFLVEPELEGGGVGCVRRGGGVGRGWGDSFRGRWRERRRGPGA